MAWVAALAITAVSCSPADASSQPEDETVEAVDVDEWVASDLIEFGEVSDAVVHGVVAGRAATKIRIGGDAGMRYDVWTVAVEDVVIGSTSDRVQVILLSSVDGQALADGATVSGRVAPGEGDEGIWFLTELDPMFDPPVEGDNYVLTNSEGVLLVGDDGRLRGAQPGRPIEQEIDELGTLEVVIDHLRVVASDRPGSPP